MALRHRHDPDATDPVGGVRLAPTSKTATKATPKRTNGAEGNGAASGLVDPGELLQFHRDMLLIRRFEERSGQENSAQGRSESSGKEACC